jgi:acetate kinase
MDEYSLVLNAGSSSLKFCVYRAAASAWQLDTRGQIDSIGTSPRLAAKNGDGQKVADERLEGTVTDARTALDALARWLRAQYPSARVQAVGHRVVHGGARYSGPVVVTPQVLEDLRTLIPLAPLHQPYNLAAIEAVFERMPKVPQPEVAGLVPLPREICKGDVQRYGFHGLSYEYIASVLPKVAPEIAHGRVIVAHLGSGASLCALRSGKSIDSTLGFTALDGLCMGTRPGAVDPGVILYLFQDLKLSAKEVETILYKKSGLLGISGTSNDMRDLLASTEPAARLAVDYFVYRAAREIGGLAAVLGGIDALVFTAGIGENSPVVRSRICHSSSWLGIEIDPAANTGKGPRISRPSSRVSVWVIPTNEELMIARHTSALLGLVEARA